MAHVSHSTSHCHMATAFHFFREKGGLVEEGLDDFDFPLPSFSISVSISTSAIFGPPVTTVTDVQDVQDVASSYTRSGNANMILL